jgi:hypothetical protein
MGIGLPVKPFFLKLQLSQIQKNQNSFIGDFQKNEILSK